MIEAFDQILGLSIGAEAQRAVLGALGVVSSVLTFAITSVMSRPAMIRWRNACWWILAMWWIAVVATLIDVLQPISPGAARNLGTKAALLLWLAGLVWLLQVVRRVLFVHRRALTEMARPVLQRPFRLAEFGEFGVAFVNGWLADLQQVGRKIRFPVLVVAERGTPGLTFCHRFLGGGLARGAGIVYVTFTRPASVVARQIDRILPASELGDRVIVVDCYSTLYARARRPRTIDLREGRRIRVEHVDPRDPIAVQDAYKQALVEIHRQLESDGKPAPEVRTLYDSLSDFLAIADAELVSTFMRHIMVFEEQWNVQAMYLLWPDVLAAPVSESYLSWFANAVIRLERDGDRTIAQLENVGPHFLRAAIEADLDFADRGLEIRGECVHAFARAIARLDYAGVPFSDPDLHPESGTASDRATAVDYFFFLTSIDHATHSSGATYEEIQGARLYRSSDLMYRRARQAAARDPNLFTAARLADVSEQTVAELFRGSSGVGIFAPGLRAFLLRNAAQVLLDEYDGAATNLLDASDGYLNRRDGTGLLERLSRIRAYEDPVRKKSQLLVKLLVRQRLWEPKDPKNLGVAVDSVLAQIALRSGLVVMTDPGSRDRMRRGEPLSESTSTRLRLVVARAFQQVAEIAELAPDLLDDLLWGFGRELRRLAADDPLDGVLESPFCEGVANRDAVVPLLELMVGISPHASVDAADHRAPRFPESWFY